MSSKPETTAVPDVAVDDTNGFGVKIPFAKYLGLHVTEQTPAGARLRVDRRPELLNSWGVMTGGVIMTMLDLAMGAAVRGQVGATVSVATMDISMAFMNPAKGDFYVEGRVLQATKTAYFCEAEARAGDGTLIAKGIGTLKPLPPKYN
jgi:uncharacterized protein (TIGR00369 family)